MNVSNYYALRSKSDCKANKVKNRWLLVARHITKINGRRRFNKKLDDSHLFFTNLVKIDKFRLFYCMNSFFSLVFMCFFVFLQ